MASQSIDELFDKYPDERLELIFMTDIDLNKEPFYYRVIFKFVKGNKKYYPTAEVAPEYLHKKYKVGAVFYKGKQIGYHDDIDIFSFEINNEKIHNTYMIADVLDSTVIVDKTSNLNFYINKQNCYLIEYDKYDLIIPHYTIANHFHFKSASLKNAILNNTMDYLYHRNSFFRIDSDNVKLHVKHKANQQDLKDICTLLEDNYCRSTFYDYHEQRKNSNNLVAIEAQFPYLETFNIKATVKKISEDSKDKYIVLGIYEDSYNYKFKIVNYKTDEANGDFKQKIEKGFFTKEVPTRRTNKNKNTKPSSKYLSHYDIYVDKHFRDENNIHLNKEVNNILSHNPLITKEADITVDSSSEESTSHGDEEVQQEVLSSKNEAIRDKEIFNILDFEKLLQKIMIDKNVENLQFNELKKFRLPMGINIIPAKYYTQDNVVRHYLSGSFSLNNINIGFVEIEQSDNWKSISTWFFIFHNSNISNNDAFINKVFKMYVVDKKILKNIDKLLLNHGVIFIRTVHPANLTYEKVSNWRERLLILLENRI
jgi:hypothetical protein